MSPDLHSALKTEVVKTFKCESIQFAQVRLQHGKERFTETIHAKPTTYSSSGLQLTDFLAYLGFTRSHCSYLTAECYVREVLSDFDIEEFGNAFCLAYVDFSEGVKCLEDCGIFMEQPEGWGFFYGKTSKGRDITVKHGRGDGHTAPHSQRLKESEDSNFRFVFSWLDGAAFKGWVTHYRPKQSPLSEEFEAVLAFVGGFNRFHACPQFDFEPCKWRSIAFGEDNENWVVASANKFFDAHASRFSSGMEKLLAAYSKLSRFGVSFLNLTKSVIIASPVGLGHPPTSMLRTVKSKQPYKYDVAISFASTERPQAELVAKIVRSAKFNVFYDNFYPVQLWGKDLVAEFDKIYRKESRFCLMLISDEYAKRMWTTHERRSVLARMIEENGKDYILPVRVDDTDIDGLQPSICYLSLKNQSIEEIAKILVEKLKSQA